MRAIIPVAGIGSRLKPFTNTLPKALLNVAGKPIIGHIIDKLLTVGITEATFVYGYLGDQIISYVKKKYPKLKAEFVEQESPEGLGHAIYTAIPTIKKNEELFIILGDTIFDVALKKVFAKKVSSLGVKAVDDPSRFGVALLKDGFIDKLIEKPTTPVSNLALTGLYYIRHSAKLIEALNYIVHNNLRNRGEFQLTDALQNMVESGEKVSVFEVEGWYDCGKPETLLATNHFLLSKYKEPKPIDTVVIIPPVFIAKNAVVKNSVIGPYATIDENVTIAESIIRNSIISTNAEINTAMLDNSIVGSNCIINGSYKRLNSGDSTEIDFY